MQGLGNRFQPAKEPISILDSEELVGIECSDGIGAFGERPGRQFVQPIGLSQRRILSPNDGDWKTLVAKRIEDLLAAVATAMGYDVQMLEISNVMADECFENVLFVANHGNSNETHCGFSSKVEN